MASLWKRFTDLAFNTILAWFMKICIVALIPYSFYIGDYLFSLAAILATILALLPSILERNLKITLPWELNFFITLALYLHAFLGEIFHLYDRLPYWDDITHFLGTAVISLLAFLTVFSLHFTRRLQLTLPFIGLFTVTFAMAVGAIWEIGEFFIDQVTGRNTQYGLTNTMYDLIYDFLGGITVAFFGIIYIRKAKPVERLELTRSMREIFRFTKKSVSGDN